MFVVSIAAIPTCRVQDRSACWPCTEAVADKSYLNSRQSLLLNLEACLLGSVFDDRHHSSSRHLSSILVVGTASEAGPGYCLASSAARSTSSARGHVATKVSLRHPASYTTSCSRCSSCGCLTEAERRIRLATLLF